MLTGATSSPTCHQGVKMMIKRRVLQKLSLRPLCVMLAAAALCCTSCLTVVARDYKKNPGKTIEFTTYNWAFGTVPYTKQVECPKGVQRISEGMTFPNFLLTAVTLGIVVVRTSEVKCAS
jgi:hypothetical protein